MDIGGPPNGVEVEQTVVVDLSADTDVVLRKVTYLIFDRIHSLLRSCNIYSEGEEW